MSAQNQNTSLIDKAKARLLELAPKVSREDKKILAKKVKVTTKTIGLYLDGDVRDIGTAEKVIKHLKPIIAKREKELAAS